jgi:transcriptional regulator with XRE-family HTH domain
VPRLDPDKFVRHVTKRVAEARRALGLSQAEAAQRMGIAAKNWQRIEQGQNLTLHTLARVATVLECTPTDLVGHSAVSKSDERRRER